MLQGTRSLRFVLIVAGALGAADAAVATVRRVDTNSPCAGSCATGEACDGSTWARACKKLRDAIAASCNGDELWVAQGTYYPDECTSATCTDNNRSETFTISNPAVALYGGFAGNETARNERDWNLYETILSGDIDNDGLLDVENIYHVVTYSTPGAASVLDGVTITMGYADGIAQNNQGSAVHIRDANKCLAGGPILRNCRIRSNYAFDHAAVNDHGLATLIDQCYFEDNDTAFSGKGGALLIQAGATIVTDTVFYDNTSGEGGGAVWVEHDTDSTCNPGGVNQSCPKFERCEFRNNSLNGYYGGAIYIIDAGRPGVDYADDSKRVQFIACTFSGNRILPGGGGAASALSAKNSYVKVERCRVINNEGAGNYGAFSFLNSDSKVFDSLFFNNGSYSPTISSIVGALYFEGPGTALVQGCTIAHNRNRSSGSAILSEVAGQTTTIKNSIVWGNDAPQIRGATTFVTYSDIEGGHPGTGNIDDNPLFVNSGTGDYRPAGGSPCIDAGNNSASLSSADLDGGPRLFDDPATSDTGAGTPPIVDIGAYEWSDCDNSQVDDAEEIDQQPGMDCNNNHLPDVCEPFVDCNTNTVRDMCDISSGFSEDCNDNLLPDECEPFVDCNTNSVLDICDISSGFSTDCNENSNPDSCDISTGTRQDCDGNGVPDECDPDCQPNGVPDGCDIAGSTSEDVNGNGTPDECELMTPSGVNKNRSLSVSVPMPTTACPGLPTALRVRLIELQNPIPPNLPQNPPPNFSAFESGATCSDPIGCVRWVGQPGAFLESQDNPAQGNFRAARLQCTPYYHDWTAEGIFQIVGSEIVPSSTYTIESLAASCAGDEDICANLSSPLQLKTARYGDISAAFNPPSTTAQPDAIDILQIVNKLKGLIGAPSKAIAQLQPNLPELNADVNALDIVAVVDAVKGKAYAFSGPCPCPSTVTCGPAMGSVACSTSTPCVTAFGAGAMCVKTCSGGANAGDPCINNTHCPGSVCGAGFCRDACGRCKP